MIEFNAVGFGRGDNALLREFSWQLPDPGIYLLLGGNGTGKSLLCSLLAGRIRADSGVVSLMGEPASRLAGQVWYADGALAINEDETVEEYIEYELSCSGAAGSAVDDCLSLLDRLHRRMGDSLLSQLPHHELLLVQIAIATLVESPLRILDGHFTWLDDHYCRIAAQMLQSFSVKQENFMLLTASRVAGELPDLQDTWLLSRSRPIQFSRVSGEDAIDTGMQKLSSSTAISVYYRNTNLSPNDLVSGESYRVLSRLEGGLNLELSGSLDDCLAELAARGIEIRRIDLQQN
ncbi:ATP-binding cassette domain-containing protein [bacterium]|nr:ATP-binding cassette domain-containing protein [bacterium]